MTQFNLTNNDIYFLIEALIVMDQESQLLSAAIEFAKKLNDFIENNSISVSNKWLLDRLLISEQK